MAEYGVLALCFQAPGETAAALACAAVAFGLAYALAAILTATSPPSPHLRPHPRRPTREGGPPAFVWLASGYHQGAGRNAGALCTRCAPAHKAERSRASQLRKLKRQSGL